MGISFGFIYISRMENFGSDYITGDYMQNENPKQINSYLIDFDYGTDWPFWEGVDPCKNIHASEIKGLSPATILLSEQAGKAWKEIQWKLLDFWSDFENDPPPLPRDLSEKRANVYRMLLTLTQFARADRPDLKFTLRFNR